MSKYTDFVKAHIGKVKGANQKDKFRAVAALWRKQKGGKGLFTPGTHPHPAPVATGGATAYTGKYANRAVGEHWLSPHRSGGATMSDEMKQVMAGNYASPKPAAPHPKYQRRSNKVLPSSMVPGLAKMKRTARRSQIAPYTPGMGLYMGSKGRGVMDDAMHKLLGGRCSKKSLGGLLHRLR